MASFADNGASGEGAIRLALSVLFGKTKSVAAPEFELIVGTDGAEIARHVVKLGAYVIGREPGCEIVVDSVDLSRRHAKLTVNASGCVIEDLGSRNGTLLEGRRVTAPARFVPGQEVRIGSVSLELRALTAEGAGAGVQRNYAAFISYRHADNRELGRQWASWLHQTIETYEVPTDLVGTQNDHGQEIPARIFPVFRDEEELPADADLSTPIVRALENSSYLVVLCSPGAASSRFVADEIRRFKAMGKSDRVVAAIIAGEPNTVTDAAKQAVGWTKDHECFPEPLRYEVEADGSISGRPAEPIAADFRLEDCSEGWTTPEAYRESLKGAGLALPAINHRVDAYAKRLTLMKLKVLAGILDVPLGMLTKRDQAYQLEQARRRARTLRRWLAIVAGLALLAVAAGAIALKQKNVAERATGAEKRARQSLLRRLYGAVFLQIQRGWEDRDFVRIRAGLDSTRSASGDPDLRGWEWYYLNSTFQIPSRSIAVEALFPKHTIPPPGAVAWSPSGQWIATGGGTGYAGGSPIAGSLQVWDAETGMLLRTLALSGTSLAWNSKGHLLAGIVNNRVRIWELPSGKILQEYAGQKGTLRNVAWCPGSQLIAASGYDDDELTKTTRGELLIWDVSKDKAVLDLAWPDKGVRGIEWNPDGASLAVSWKFRENVAHKYYVSLINPKTSEEAGRMETASLVQFGVSEMAWRKDGDTIAMNRVGAADGPLDLFDTKTKKRVRMLDKGRASTWNMAGGGLLSVASNREAALVKLWEPAVSKRSTVLWLDTGWNTTLSWSPDGMKFATLGYASSKKLWQCTIWEIEKLRRDHETLYVHPAKSSTTFAWNRRGTLLASGSADGEVCVCDAISGAPLARAKLHTGEVLSIDWSPHSKELLSVGKDGRVMIWAGTVGRDGEFLFPKETQAVVAAWSEDGKRVAIGERSGRIVIWDVKHYLQLYELTGHAAPIAGLKWHPQRDEIASADERGKLILWNCTAKAMIASAETEHGMVRSIAYVSNGERLATCGNDHRVRIWNATRLTPGPILTEHSAAVVAVSWNSADGRLASVDEEGVIWIWDTDLAQGLLRIQDTVVSPSEKHEKPPYGWFYPRQLAWSPDGMRLAASGGDSHSRDSDGIIHIWNATRPDTASLHAPKESSR